MQIGALSFRPYIYNTNTLNRNSMSKVASIGNDLTAGKTDFDSLADESLNENPLKKGQTVNFSNVLDKQMHMGRMNALRIMKPGAEVEEAVNPKEIQADDEMFKDFVKEKEMPYNLENGKTANKNGVDSIKAAEDFEPVSGGEKMLHMQSERNLFQMQRAAEAYQMNMIA